MVVLAITAALSAMFIASSGGANGQIALYTDTSKVISVLQRARTLALDKYNPSPSSGSPCAFGVVFYPLEYALYEKPYSVCSGYTYNTNTDKILQKFNLDARVQFSNITIPWNAASSSIYFIPPYFTTSSLANVIVLQIKGTNTTSSVTVSPGGGITSQ